MQSEMIVPSGIPIASLMGKDLEECVYWLIDCLGGKDLEWRHGGAAGGAADGGRDLEAQFLIPGPDGEISTQRWWVEAKGRSATVKASAVKEAVHNAAGRGGLDVLIVATNSIFSNPTRDWLADWQKSERRLRVKLWDRHHLEKLLSRHPEVVIRLFARALSPQGKLEVVRSRFWNHSAYAGAPLLDEFWDKRKELTFSDRALLATLMSECANGDVCAHPWVMTLDDARKLTLFNLAMRNILYFCFRADDAGVSQDGYLRGTAYLLLAALEVNDLPTVTEAIEKSWSDIDDVRSRNIIRRHAIGIVVATLSRELLDACTADCLRVSVGSHGSSKRARDAYWLRLFPPHDGPPAPKEAYLIVEDGRQPCNAGLPLSTTIFCPLTRLERDAEKLDVRTTLKALQAVARGRLQRLASPVLAVEASGGGTRSKSARKTCTTRLPSRVRRSSS